MEEKIKQWKAQYGEVYCVSIEDKKCYLHAPSRQALAYAGMAGKTDPLKFNEVLLNDCWIEGDEIMRTNDAYFLGICQTLADIVEIKTATLEKL